MFSLKRLLTATSVALLLPVVAQAQSIDIEAIKKKQMPPAGSVAEADTCAVEMALMAYLVEQIETSTAEEKDSFKTVAAYWLNKAAAKHGMTYEQYTQNGVAELMVQAAEADAETHFWFAQQCLNAIPESDR